MTYSWSLPESISWNLMGFQVSSLTIVGIQYLPLQSHSMMSQKFLLCYSFGICSQGQDHYHHQPLFLVVSTQHNIPKQNFDFLQPQNWFFLKILLLLNYLLILLLEFCFLLSVAVCVHFQLLKIIMGVLQQWHAHIS